MERGVKRGACDVEGKEDGAILESKNDCEGATALKDDCPLFGQQLEGVDDVAEWVLDGGDEA